MIVTPFGQPMEQPDATFLHVDRSASAHEAPGRHGTHAAAGRLEGREAGISMTFATPVDGPGPRSLLGLKAALSLLSSERDALLAAVRQTKDEGLVTQAGRLSRALDLFLHQHRRWDDESEGRPHESVAAGIREYRIRNGLSQEDLAARAGLSVRALRYIESGRTRRPRPATMRLLSDAFGLESADRDRFCLAAGTRIRSVENGSTTRDVA